MIALHNIGSQRSLEPIGFQACAEPLDGDDQAVSCTELNHRISPTPERDGALNHHARYEALSWPSTAEYRMMKLKKKSKI